MAPRVNNRSTVYELCKKRIESKQEFQKQSYQSNSHNFEFRLSAQENLISPKECSDRFQLCQQYMESNKEKDHIKKELQSASMSNKSELFRENNSFPDKVHDQDTEKRLWLNYQMLQTKLAVCSICYSLFENEIVLNQHVRKCHGKKRGRKATPMECNVCQMKFTCKQDFTIHYKSHSSKINIYLKEPNKCSNKFEMCRQYIESCKKKDHIKVELQSDSMSNKSDFCRENMNPSLEKIQKQGTEKHLWLNNEMLQKKLVVCSICYASFENETILIQHFRNFHKKKPGRKAQSMECIVCQMKFACKQDYTIHYKTHSSKTCVCPYGKEMCTLKFPHKCKNDLKKKPKQNVWDACKEVLTDKHIQQIKCTNSESVQKIPISKYVLYVPKNKKKTTLSVTPLRILRQYRPLRMKNRIIIHSTQNSISCAQNSAEQSFDESKNLNVQGSENQMYFEGEVTNSDKTDDTKFFCRTCNIFFKKEKYEAHYAVHLNEELCQIREGDEELHVCDVCGCCFAEKNAFQVHILSHVKKE